MSEDVVRPIKRLPMSHVEATAIRDLASEAVAGMQDARPDAQLRRIALLSQELPVALRRTLVDFRLSGDGGLVISGLPLVDADLGATPPIDGPASRRDEVARADAMLLLIASFLGYPVSQAGVDDGRLVLDVSPVPGHETTQLGSSSSGELMWHNEDAYHPLRPDWICLLCLRNPDRTATSFAQIADVPIDEPTRSVLFQQRFHIEPDTSNTASATAAEPPAVAVLTGDRSRPFVRLDPAFMIRDCDGEASDALEIVTKTLVNNGLRGRRSGRVSMSVSACGVAS